MWVTLVGVCAIAGPYVQPMQLVLVLKKKSTNTQLYLLFELLTHASFFNFALLPLNGELKKTHFLTNQ